MTCCTGRWWTPPAGALLFCLCLFALLWSMLVCKTRTATAETPKQGQPQHTNRLAKETSPYLLLHAHNPVDWYPWGDEAFDKARQEKKLVFLSIGYSSCYWCHVMERESFMDEQIAAYLNQHFVCIKVDREERPDIDQIYMTALQMLTGRGGWPLSMFLTPESLPIVGGTYFPPQTVDGRTGFLDVIQRLQGIWDTDAVRMNHQADVIANAVRRQLAQPTVAPTMPTADVEQQLLTALKRQFDAAHGGFGFDEGEPQRPKFPEPSNLVFLIDFLHRNPGHEQATEMLTTTLDRMAAGGIYDHVGGGFHRYSVDRFWQVPHFEKMLYDNGQLASVYATSGELLARDDYHRIAAEICQFVLQELTAPEGGFYAALDAETEAHEGKFYVWDGEALDAALNRDQRALVDDLFGTSGEPNFEGHFVLQRGETYADVAARRGILVDQLITEVGDVRAKLLAARDARPRPLTDTKVLAAWNGLMIEGMADTGRLLSRTEFVEAAVRAADFVLTQMMTPTGRLLRTHSGGEAKLNAYLDDYAFMTRGLLALERATHDPRWSAAAEKLTNMQRELFWDEQGGGFFFTSHDHEQLWVRVKDPFDSALPSGNNVAAANLLELSATASENGYHDDARRTILAAAPLLTREPLALPRLAATVGRYHALRQPAAALPATE